MDSAALEEQRSRLCLRNVMMRPSGAGRRSSAGNNSMFYEGNEVCKQGHLRKSPPPNRFYSQSSWKKRLFILTKSKQSTYALHYYKMQHSEKRGLIEISQISHIQHGINDEKKRASVCKMFHCQPDRIISLRTTDRDYFLIGEEKKDVEEWLEAISSAWKEMRREDNSEQNRPIGGITEDFETPVPFSFVTPSKGGEDCDKSVHEDKKRPSSDHLPSTTPYPDIPRSEVRRRPNSDPLPDPPVMYRLPEPETSSIQTMETTYSAQDRKSYAIYDVPRRCQDSEYKEPMECDELQESGNGTQESDDEMASQDHYMKMNPILNCKKASNSLPQIRSRASSTDSQSSAEEYNQNKSCRNCASCTCGRKCKNFHNHIGNTDEPKFEKKSNGLSDVKLKILLSECVDASQLEKKDFDLPINDIKKYLMLTEIGNRVCVSNWQGPSCIFNYGDQITSVNDLGIESKAEVFEYIDRAIKKKVTLSLLRIPNSKVFHGEDCLCSQHY